MAQAFALDDGSHELELPGGMRLKTALAPDRLREIGYDIGPHPGLTDPSRGALADASGAPTGKSPFATTAADERSMADWIRSAPARDQAQGFMSDLRADAANHAHAPAAPSSPARFDQLNNLAPAAEPSADKPKTGVERHGATIEHVDIAPERGGGGATAAPRGAMVRASQDKGTDIRTGYSVQRSAAAGELPEAEADQALANDLRREAERQTGEVKSEQLNRESGLAGIEARRRQLEADALRARQEQMERTRLDYQARQGELDRESDAINKMEVDPNRYWSNMGTGGKVLAAIGMIASGLTAGLNGGPNQSMEFLHRALREDIEDQKQRIAARKQGAAIKQTQLERATELLHGDSQLAERQVEANHQAMAAALIRKYAAEAGVKNVGPQLLAFGAQLDQDSANQRLENRAKFGEKTAEQFQWMPDRYVGGTPAAKESDVHQLSRDEEGAGVGAAEAENGEFRDLISAMPSSGIIPTEETRNIISRKVRGALDTIGGAGTGASVLDSDAERQAAAKFTRAQNILKHKALGAAQSDKELEGYNRGIDMENTVEGLQRKDAELTRALSRRQAGIRAGSRPEVVQEYERRKQHYSPNDRPGGLRRE
jgi:hypothetical protein